MRKAIQIGMIVLGGLLLRIPVLLAQESANVIDLSVDAREASRGMLHAQLRIPVQPGPLTLLYPKWLPGEHGPTGPIRDLVGLKFSAAGQDVPWQRDSLDMYAFHCVVPPGTRMLEVSLDFLVPMGGGGFTSGASATPHLAILSWNTLLLYPKGRRAADLTYVARLQFPAGWKFGAALPVERESSGSVEFKPVSLTTLVDSPLLAGAHFRRVPLSEGTEPAHYIDMASDSEDALEMSPELAASYKRLVAETGALFGARHYGRYHFLLTLSDHVAHFGLEHHESSDNRVVEKTLSDDAERKWLAYLLAHEFAHSWNGKYRRPAALLGADFHQPFQTDLLWVYEGLTSYLGAILPPRSGLWSAQDIRDELAMIAADMDERPGRTWRPLVDTAVAAQVLYDVPRGGWSAWRRGSRDFYDESVLIWLEADVLLRQRSQGRYSLDDFARRFHGGQSGAPEVLPYTFDDVVATLAELVPYDWKAFFNDRLNSKAPRAPLGGIEGSGWRLVYRDTPSDGFKQSEQASQFTDLWFSIGVTLREGGVIGAILPNGPADRASLAPEVKLIAVNGRKFSVALLKQAIKAAKGTTAPIELLVEDREFFKTLRVDYHDGERYPHLERDASKPDVLEQIIQPRGR